MQYYRCKCGKREFWGSGMVPAPCDGCDECGTTLTQNLDNHETPRAHQLIRRYKEETGEPYWRCELCYQAFDWAPTGSELAQNTQE